MSPRNPGSDNGTGTPDRTPTSGSPLSPRFRPDVPLKVPKPMIMTAKLGGRCPPQCKCCATICPCCFCFHPDEVLDREELIMEMRKASRGRHVNIALVEDQLVQDRQRRMGLKARWRRRWMVCCCCCGVLNLVLMVVLVIAFSIGSWLLLCSGKECGFEARTHLGAVLTPDKRILVVGGLGNGGNLDDVWVGGADGKNWQRIVEHAPFGPRHGHVLLCSPGGGELFVIAGDAGGAAGKDTRLLHDVWISTNGQDWALQTNAAPFPPRKFFGAVVDDVGALFLAGGLGDGGTGGLNDVWFSKDKGLSWQPATRAAPWTARHSMAFARLPGGTRAGRFYLLGGNDGRRLNDVWSSDDQGRTWTIMEFSQRHEQRYTTVEETASWSPRVHFRAVADDSGVLTVVGGETDEEGYASLSQEVWQLPSPPSDEVAWYAAKNTDNRLNTAYAPLQWEQKGAPPWTPRRGLQAFMDDSGTPYIVGGEDRGGLKSDAWKMDPSFNIRNVEPRFRSTQANAQQLAKKAAGPR